MNKQIYIVSLFFILIVSNAIGQTKEYYFSPKWIVGEKKTISIVQSEKEYKAGKLVEDTTTYMEGEMVVLKDNGDNYTLKVLYDNVALKSVQSFYTATNEELKVYKKLALIYKINKKDGKSELLNWKEVQSFMNESFSQINSLMKKKNPDLVPLTKMMLLPIQESFKSKENIEAYMYKEIGDIVFPYGTKYKIADTIRMTESSANPFNAADTVSQTTISYLSNVNETLQTCDINKVIRLDLEKFKAMLTSMILQMSNSSKATDEQKKQIKEDVKNVKMESTNLTVIHFNYKSTWVTDIKSTVTIIVNDSKKTTEKRNVRTVVVK